MSDFWNGVKRVADEHQHSLALQGLKSVSCSQCDGRGKIGKGYWESDGYGRLWRDPPTCRHCSYGRVQTQIEPAGQIKAIDREIERLKKRRAALKKEVG